jgi:hypothetical protein
MIDWTAFLVVAGSSLAATAIVVSLYSFGLRFRYLTRRSGPDAQPARPVYATVLSYLCFALSASAVLVGIYLIVPFLHG